MQITMNRNNMIAANIDCMHLHTIVKHPITVSISWRWVSMDRQQFWVLPFWQSEGYIETFFPYGIIDHLYRQNRKRYTRCPILERSVKVVLTSVDIASWMITGLRNSISPYWQYMVYICEKVQLLISIPLTKVSIHWVSIISSLPSWTINGLCNNINP
jgi:hypothetical protein